MTVHYNAITERFNAITERFNAITEYLVCITPSVFSEFFKILPILTTSKSLFPQNNHPFSRRIRRTLPEISKYIQPIHQNACR